MVKPFLRLNGIRHEAGPALCVCDLVTDFPMRISFIERDGFVKAYAEAGENGRLVWWPYVNIMTKSSLIILPS